jgi:3-methyladenine DNA glycosylase/8-oxoguanine DNA glycosylase
VRSIIYQMLTGKSAETIYRRVRALTPGPTFPRPAEVLDMPEDRLLGCGLSRDKARAIRDLARRAESGELRLSRLGRLPDEEIVAELTAVRGIGVWTAQMFLIFRLGRLDVMPLNDVGIQEGIRRLDGLSERPRPREVLVRSEPWRPLASVASWALWRLVDGDG